MLFTFTIRQKIWNFLGQFLIQIFFLPPSLAHGVLYYFFIFIFILILWNGPITILTYGILTYRCRYLKVKLATILLCDCRYLVLFFFGLVKRALQRLPRGTFEEDHVRPPHKHFFYISCLFFPLSRTTPSRYFPIAFSFMQPRLTFKMYFIYSINYLLDLLIFSE